MEDKRMKVMTILQDYFGRDTPLDVVTRRVQTTHFVVYTKMVQLKIINHISNKNMELNKLAIEIYSNNKEKRFWDQERNVGDTVL